MHYWERRLRWEVECLIEGEWPQSGRDIGKKKEKARMYVFVLQCVCVSCAHTYNTFTLNFDSSAHRSALNQHTSEPHELLTAWRKRLMKVKSMICSLPVKDHKQTYCIYQIRFTLNKNLGCLVRNCSRTHTHTHTHTHRIFLFYCQRLLQWNLK